MSLNLEINITSAACSDLYTGEYSRLKYCFVGLRGSALSENIRVTEPAAEQFDVSTQEFVANAVGAFSRALSDRMVEAVENATNLNKSACYVLVQVGSEPGSCIETLRCMLNIDHSTLVRALKKLEHSGLIVRSRGTPNDARRVSVTLTAAGETYFTRILEARRAVLHKAVGNLQPDELGLLHGLIAKMTGSVVRGGDDQHFVCRLCDLEACPQEICPVNCAHPEHFELPDVPFRRTSDSRFARSTASVA